MSLNGLDATDVNEAYVSALGEGGGWYDLLSIAASNLLTSYLARFLLQYTSRAEVGLLKKGSGGIPEVKETVARYVERSPLYGFLHYRRRKVLLKYVPEGTSRLLQGKIISFGKSCGSVSANYFETARLAVHSQSITETFSPHDTVFSFTTAAELVDNALSAACSLHTAPASIKSSTSLRQKGLAGITEDACESHSTVVPSSSVAEENGEPLATQLDMTRPDGQHNNACPSPPRQNASPAPSTQTIFNTDKALPPTPDSPIENERSKRSTDHDDFQVRPSFEGRHSTQSARPSTREGYSAYEFKPKVKLGPRPSLDNNTGTPNSDPTSRAYDPRPVSTLPASVRMPARKAMASRPNAPRRVTPPTSQPGPASKPSVASSTISSNSSVSLTPTVVPEQSTTKPTSTIHPRLLTVESKTPTMTPEKKRLMRALELRQRQMAAQKKTQDVELEIDTRSQIEPTTKHSGDEVLVESSPEAAEDPEDPDILQTAMRDENLGIVHLGTADLVRSNCADVDASPISVLGTSGGTSTQASSVSEDEPYHINNGKDDYVRPKPDEDLKVTEGAGSLEHLEKTAEHIVQTPFHHHSGALEVSGKSDLESEPQAESSGRQEEKPPQKPDLVNGDTYLKSTEGDCVSLHEEAVQSTGNMTNGYSALLPTTNKEVVTVYSPVSPQQESLPPSPGVIRHGSDEIFPHEVPLPVVGEDEKMLLSPPGVSESSQSIPSTPKKTESIPQTTTGRLEEDCETINNDHSPGPGPSTADTIAEKRECARQYRRHGLVEPMQRVSSGENSDDQFLSDDSFMEELKGATVQEAKPISVSKSPITPVFPRVTSEQRQESAATRSVSSPLDSKDTRNSNISPQSSTLLSPRSISASKPRSTSPSDIATPMLGKVGVSSGISQRIKALEKLSSKPSSPTQPNSSPISTAPAIASLSSRKTSFRSSPGNSDPPRSRQARLAPSPILSPTTSFENSHPKPYNQFISVDMASKPGKSRPESISVTARIVRDERSLNPEVPRDASEPCIMDLHHSPLKVEHKSADPVPPSKKPPILRHITAPSVSSNNTEPAPSPRRDSIASGSNGSRRGSDVGLPRSASEVSLSGINNGEAAKEEKKESRKSRLLKRMVCLFRALFPPFSSSMG